MVPTTPTNPNHHMFWFWTCDAAFQAEVAVEVGDEEEWAKEYIDACLRALLGMMGIYYSLDFSTPWPSMCIQGVFIK